jgi:hypothetical protein
MYLCEIGWKACPSNMLEDRVMWKTVRLACRSQVLGLTKRIVAVVPKDERVSESPGLPAASWLG